MDQRGGVGNWKSDVYLGGSLLLFALLVWCWHWNIFFLPLGGGAPQMVLVMANGFMPEVPQPVYQGLGSFLSLIFNPETGLRVLALLGGLVGLAALLFVMIHITGDRWQRVVCGVLFVLFPVAMRQAVVQETGAVLFGFLMLAFAVLLSFHGHRHLISGVLFGLAVGVHPSILWAVPGFGYLLHTKRMVWQGWVLAVGFTLIVCWGWVLVQFMTDPVSGSFWRYLGAGLSPGFGGGGLGAFVHLVDLQIRLFGWGGFVFGSLGLLLLVFQNRSQFLLFALLGLPFLSYSIFCKPGIDLGLYLTFVGPMFAIGLATTWRLGSRYLAEGLQESHKTMMWIMTAVMVSVQVIGNFYTDNIWQMALKQQNQLKDHAPALQILQQHIQQQTRKEDLVVVIPDAERPGGLGLFESRWAVTWYLQRQIIWGRSTGVGWEFDTVPWHQAQSRNWMSVRQEVDDAFVEQVMRSGRRLVCTEPFPFLHSDRVSMWMAALPATEEKTPLFFLYPGWPKAPDHHRVAEVFLDVFNAYVANGYWTDAAACLQGVIVYRPEDVAAHRKLGDLYMKLGQFQSAETIYSRLLVLTPDDESVAINLSGAYFSQGQIEQAITVCETFLTHRGNNPEVLFNLAGYYQHANRLDMTEKMYEAYLALGNQTARYNEVLGLLNTLRQKP